MMICKADFEELFPSQFQGQDSADAPDGSEMPAPAQAGALAAAIPAALAYSAARAMLSGYEDMARNFYAASGNSRHSSDHRA